MLCWLRAAIKKSEFDPGLLGIFTNPFYFARRGLYQAVRQFSTVLNGRLLDVGCGSKPYRTLLSTTEYIGLEIKDGHPCADVFYDGKRFPFNDGHFDTVLTCQVLEHVFNPDEFLSEINRVLVPEGLLLLTVPFLWDEHEQPVDYARYSSFGVKHLVEKNGFCVIEQTKSVSDIRVVFQLINAYIFKKTVSRSFSINLLTTLVLMAPVNLLGEMVATLLPSNVDLYLDNVVLARKRHQKDAI